MPTKKTTPSSFEQALSELTAIVQQMEKNELKLEDALKNFERGVALISQCQQSLKSAEQKVKLLTEKNQLRDFHLEE